MFSSFSSVFGPKFSVLVIALAALSSITGFCSLPQLQIIPLTQQSQEEMIVPPSKKMAADHL